MNNKYDEIIKRVISKKEIAEFIKENKLTKNEINNNFGIFLTCSNYLEECGKCLGKKDCAFDDYMQAKLSMENGQVILAYKECPYKVNKDYLLEMLYFPEVDIEDQELICNSKRNDVFKAIDNFNTNYKANKYAKGLYIHGSFGSGKTFILLKLAKQLTKMDKSVLFVYYPDLVRNLRSAVASGTLEEIVDKLKGVDILMLDDIGAENNTNFIRDDVLGPVLNYRLNANLPVFMTSNYDLNLLRQHLTETSSEINTIKSDRIIERIRYMMEVVSLTDVNHRN